VRRAGAIFLALFAALLAGSALAQSFRCTGKDGKKYYGSTIPPQCLGLPIEQLSAQGVVIRRIEPQMTEAERAAKEAEAAKKREEENFAREQERRNRALLATYMSEKDIEDTRARALAENQKAIKEVEARIVDIKKRQAAFAKEMEFYQDTAKPDKAGKPRAQPKPPPKLLEDINTTEVELKAQQSLLDAKKKEVDAINTKYDEDKKRFLELTSSAKK